MGITFPKLTHCHYVTTLFCTAIVTASAAFAQTTTWAPARTCMVVTRSPEGLVPAALNALKKINVDHRITQTINHSSAAGNYHGRDTVVGVAEYTAAVDISVRCLDQSAIRSLLSALALHGFAAWYREPNVDGWKGSPHIHAVWASEPLKPRLRDQVQSWLAGRNGLVSNSKYKFWQPNEQEKNSIASAYDASKNNGAPPK